MKYKVVIIIMPAKKKVIPFAKLRGMRAELGISQKDTAKIVGISTGAYVKRENGQLPFQIPEAIILRKFFKTTLDELFDN